MDQERWYWGTATLRWIHISAKLIEIQIFATHNIKIISQK